MLPTKPKSKHGKPCNNCGFCCHLELCPLACALFLEHDSDIAPESAPGPCPALESGVGGLLCGLVSNPIKYAPVREAVVGAKALTDAAAFLIGSGKGCDASGPDDYDGVYAARLYNWATRNETKIEQAKAV